MNCPHVQRIASSYNYATSFFGKKEKCHTCGEFGTNQWLCLTPQCCYVGCGHKHGDHSSFHAKNMKHPVAVNLRNEKLFCHICEKQVFWSPAESNEVHRASSVGDNPPLGQSCKAPPSYLKGRLNVASNVTSNHSESAWSQENHREISEDTLPRGPCGLRNMGNTCYMNAALQALMFCHPINHAFIDGPTLPVYPRRINVAVAFQKLCREMWSSDGAESDSRVLLPSQLANMFRNLNPAFRGYAQQDAQEFIRLLLDRLHEEMKEPLSEEAVLKTGSCTIPLSVSYEERHRHQGTHLSSSTTFVGRRRHASSRSSISSNPDIGTVSNAEGGNEVLDYRSIISDIFRGVLRNTCQCLECGFTSTMLEPFYDLSVPIAKGESPMSSSSSSSSSSSGYWSMENGDTPRDSQTQESWMQWFMGYMKSWFVTSKISLQDALQLFFSQDDLRDDNRYFCERCNKLVDGVKRSSVERLPEMLCVHLKRFNFPHHASHGSSLGGIGESLANSSKISDPVVFPLFGLDMRPFLAKEPPSGTSPPSSTDAVTPSDIPPLYDLTAVVCHLGSSGSHGHYISYGLHHDSQQWFEMDDDSVQPCDAITVAAMLSQAYVLFYKRNDDIALQLRDQACQIEQSQHADRRPSGVLPMFVDREWVLKFNSFSHPGPVSNARLLCARHQALLPLMRRAYPNPETQKENPFPDHLLQVSPKLWDFFRTKFSGGPSISSLVICGKCEKAENELQERRLREHQFVSNSLREFRLQGGRERVFAVHMDWFNKWENFVNSLDARPPGAIENVPARERASVGDWKEQVELPPDRAEVLLETGNYGRLNSSAWNFLLSIYGGGPAIVVQRSASPSPPESPMPLETEGETATEAASPADNVEQVKEMETVEEKHANGAMAVETSSTVPENTASTEPVEE